MTTMKEIASLAHVSRATVSRVLSGSPLVRESTRESVLYWVEKTGFQPDRAAQGLIGGRTALIGLLLPDLKDPALALFAQAFEEETSKRGYDLLLRLSGGDREKEKSFPSMLVSRRADGFAAAGTSLTGEDLPEDIPLTALLAGDPDPERAAEYAGRLICGIGKKVRGPLAGGEPKGKVICRK